jgi:hypothetical protein
LREFNALHVRFYSHRFDQNDSTEVLPSDYFSRSVALLGTERPLVVATDDKPSFRRMMNEIELRDDLHLLQFEDPLLKFYMLSRAQKIAISNSSFSWWAAYLGEKKQQVIAPHRYFWFRARVRSNPFFDTRDLYPDHFDELIL